MLVQSHEDVIQLLPALPKEWNSGKFYGVCTRGAFELNLEWENGVTKKVEILSKAGKNCIISANNTVKVFSNGNQVQIKRKNGYIEFPTEKGQIYKLEY